MNKKCAFWYFCAPLNSFVSFGARINCSPSRFTPLLRSYIQFPFLYYSMCFRPGGRERFRVSPRPEYNNKTVPSYAWQILVIYSSAIGQLKTHIRYTLNAAGRLPFIIFFLPLFTLLQGLICTLFSSPKQFAHLFTPIASKLLPIYVFTCKYLIAL